MSTSSKMLTLRSSDDQVFEVEEAVACASETIKHMAEEDCAEDGIPLSNVSGPVLAKVIEYCKKHASTDADGDSASARKKELMAWDKDFLNVDQPVLFDLITAASRLNIKSLLDLTCWAAADMVKTESTEDLRQIFNIINDFTPEEQEIRRENQWAFE